MNGAVFHWIGLFTKGECLGSTKLCSLLADLAHSFFAGVFMSFVIHSDVLLREAAGGMPSEEGTVTSIKNVDLGIAELGVLKVIDTTVTITNEFCPAVMIR